MSFVIQTETISRDLKETKVGISFSGDQSYHDVLLQQET